MKNENLETIITARVEARHAAVATAMLKLHKWQEKLDEANAEITRLKNELGV